MSKISSLTMVKGQNSSVKKIKTRKLATFTTPKTVAKPMSDKAKKRKELEVGRESTILNLEKSYIDPIRKIKLRAYDLAIINDSTNLKKLFKDKEPKPDRMKNRGIDYMIPHLRLLNFLLENFNEYYRRKIWDSSPFRNLFEKYLGTAEFTSVKLSTKDKSERLKSANQWLIDSLTIIEDNLPDAFKGLLQETGKPYFNLIKAICSNEDIKIMIPDKMVR